MNLPEQTFTHMAKLIQIALILACFLGHSQEYQEVIFSELDYTFSLDSVSVSVSLNGELLDGKFKIKFDGSEDMSTSYSLVKFINGKPEGKSEFYRDGIVIMTTHFREGMKHGLNIIYDNTGKIIQWEINWVNGKKHGLVFFFASGDSYYVMGDEVSKEEFDEYERTHKRN